MAERAGGEIPKETDERRKNNRILFKGIIIGQLIGLISPRAMESFMPRVYEEAGKVITDTMAHLFGFEDIEHARDVASGRSPDLRMADERMIEHWKRVCDGLFENEERDNNGTHNNTQ